MGITDVFKDIGAVLNMRDDDRSDHPATVKGEAGEAIRPASATTALHSTDDPVQRGFDPDMVSTVNAAKARAATPRDLTGDMPGKVIGVADAAMHPKGL